VTVMMYSHTGTRSPSMGLPPRASLFVRVLVPSVIPCSFHLSLSLLVHSRSLRSIVPWRMVPPDSIKVSRAPTYSGYHYLIQLLPIRDYHPLRFIFPNDSNSICLNYCGPTTPKLPEQLWFGLFRVRSPLLTESLLFSSPPPTSMFQFSGFAHLSV